ncbi:MAG: hypothetical protein R3A52_02515 [Polyangiales bacterium]
MRDAYGPRAWALCLALVGCGSTTATPSLRLDSGTGVQSGGPPMFMMGYTAATDGGATGDQGPPPADSGTPPPVDSGTPPIDAGGMTGDGGMMGPRSCTNSTECDGACPPGSMGCTCAPGPGGSSSRICVASCNADGDCPTGLDNLRCDLMGHICVPQ